MLHSKVLGFCLGFTLLTACKTASPDTELSALPFPEGRCALSGQASPLGEHQRFDVLVACEDRDPKMAPRDFYVQDLTARKARFIEGWKDAPWRNEILWGPKGHLIWNTDSYGPIFVLEPGQLEAWLEGRITPVSLVVPKQGADALSVDGLRFDGDRLHVTVSGGGQEADGSWAPGEASIQLSAFQPVKTP